MVDSADHAQCSEDEENQHHTESEESADEWNGCARLWNHLSDDVEEDFDSEEEGDCNWKSLSGIRGYDEYHDGEQRKDGHGEDKTEWE